MKKYLLLLGMMVCNFAFAATEPSSNHTIELVKNMGYGILFSLLSIAFLIIFYKLVSYVFKLLYNNQYNTARNIKKILKIRPTKNIKELIIIKYVFQFSVFMIFVFFMILSWGGTSNYSEKFIFHFLNGFTISGIHIIPLRLIYSLIIFSAISLLGRLIAAKTIKHEKLEGEEEAQVAIASLIIYISVSIALLVSLILSGVNFTGLAIIAGALSVGIGLGLQNIVNNFVSGIILLLEKPISSGDRIKIGTTEGFVKKIRIRSTQISTLSKEDVIVPNSDLITNSVTNFMFRDSYCRIVNQVGVAYGSNVELVREVLLNIASEHEEVLNIPPNAPVALFRSFGDSSLVFELWSVIKDVNKKFIVTSDLNFSIDKEFRSRSITIAFPQRDLHIISQEKTAH